MSQETQEKIKNVFVRYPSITNVFLYGSRAKGNYHAGSDIDLTVMDTNITSAELLKIDNDLDDLLLPYKIDLSLFHNIVNSDLVNHIMRVGIEFYQRGEKA